jgi:hypothetical protein
MVFLRAQSLFSRSVAFFLSALETFDRTWGREAQNTIPHAAPASDGRICSATSHDCQARVRRSFLLLSTGLGRLHKIWPYAASPGMHSIPAVIESKGIKRKEGRVFSESLSSCGLRWFYRTTAMHGPVQYHYQRAGQRQRRRRLGSAGRRDHFSCERRQWRPVRDRVSGAVVFGIVPYR